MSHPWSRFRGFPRWAQMAVWVFLWPVPLMLWATARPKDRRTGPLVVAALSAMAWIAIPLSSSGAAPGKAADRTAVGRVDPGRDGDATSTTATADVTAADPPAPTGGSEPGASTTTSVPGSAGTATAGTAVKPLGASPPTTKTTTTTAKPAPSSDPTAVLVGLRVAPEGPRTGYQRERFVHWIDADHDGCDTREEVLIAKSRSKAQVDPYGCKVVAGDWFSSYDGLTFTDPAELEIDHMVPLAEAWDSGAVAWDAARRQAFANDLDHLEALRAVSASSNRSKGDLDPAQWKPTRDAAWCEYANDWVTVKKAWDLSADQGEVDDLEVMLRTCGGGGGQSPQPATPATTATSRPPVSGTTVTITALDCQGEAVTVRNGGPFPADLTGWSIRDEASTPHTYRFPAGYTLTPGASVTIRSGGRAAPGELAWTNQNVWNNDGDTASLVTAAGATASTRSC